MAAIADRSLRPCISTRQPREVSSEASSKPKPEVAPVTTMFLEGLMVAQALGGEAGRDSSTTISFCDFTITVSVHGLRVLC